MLGYYNYTVVLTYMSLVSAGTGILVSLSGKGHPYLGVFFLLICGLCDAFDGKVARTKKNRTREEISFGIQIDSLSDIVAFGVLPACIGIAMMRVFPLLNNVKDKYLDEPTSIIYIGVLGAILIWYILSTLIRLAYFNVTEEERQKHEDTVRKYYTGLPVTSAALVFPSVMLLQYILQITCEIDITPLYFATSLFMSFAFLSKIHVHKPGLRGILIMIGIGAVEFALIIVCMMISRL